MEKGQSPRTREKTVESEASYPTYIHTDLLMSTLMMKVMLFLVREKVKERVVVSASVDPRYTSTLVTRSVL